MNRSLNSRRIIKIETIARGRGHVRKITLECGHTMESTEPTGRLEMKGNKVCEQCRINPQPQSDAANQT